MCNGKRRAVKASTNWGTFTGRDLMKKWRRDSSHKCRRWISSRNALHIGIFYSNTSVIDAIASRTIDKTNAHAFHAYSQRKYQWWRSRKGPRDHIPRKERKNGKREKEWKWNKTRQYKIEIQQTKNIIYCIWLATTNFNDSELFTKYMEVGRNLKNSSFAVWIQNEAIAPILY